MHKKELTALDKMRPADSHREALRLREECGQKFYDQYNTRFVHTSCPACGDPGRFSFEKYGFSHQTCDSCKTTWCSPRPTEELIEEYYAKWEAPKYWTKLLLETDANRKALQYGPRVESLVGLLRESISNHSGGTAVDLGAGSGAFGLALKNSDYFDRVLALDYSENCVDACRGQGLEAELGSIETLEPDSVDLLTLNDLIEHVFDPRALLLEINRVLKPGGIVFIATPNGEGFDFKLMKENTVNITPPEHINYFNVHSIQLLLEKCNYTVLNVETPGILDTQIVTRAFLENKIDLKENEYIKFLLLENEKSIQDNFQSFIQTNKLSSHMIAVARKN